MPPVPKIAQLVASYFGSGRGLKRDAIFWMKTRGYNEWPDGRRLEDVIVTNGK